MISNASITAIVVTWNRREELGRCLDSLDRQVIPPEFSFRVIVIDDGSRDGTASWLAERTVRQCATGQGYPLSAWRLRGNAGPGLARNLALSMSQSDYVLLIDSDAWIETPGAVASFAKRLEENSELLAVGPLIWRTREHDDPFIFGGYVTRALHADLPRWRSDWEAPEFVTSCCSLWRREPLLRGGGFDPFYGHGIEDVDLCLRLFREGWRGEILPETHAIHTMAPHGRHRPFDDFDRVFRYLEWTRPYLALRTRGWRWTAREAARWAVAGRGEFNAAYGRPLGWRRHALARVFWPFYHLLTWPLRVGARPSRRLALPASAMPIPPTREAAHVSIA
ncbi:MAG: glycosyltransferase [Sumerlaeia bacterium]